MVFSVLMTTVPLIIAGIHIVRIYEGDLKNSVIHFQKEKANRVAEKTKDFLERVTSDLLFIVSDGHLTQTNPSEARAHLTHYLSRVDYLTELVLLNEKGFEIIKVTKGKTGKGEVPGRHFMTPMFQRASRGEIYYGDFQYTSDGSQTIGIAMPVEVFKGVPVRVLKARVLLQPLTQLLNLSRFGQKGATYVMDQEGYLIAHPAEKNILLGPFVDRVVAGEEGTLEFKNLRGEKYLIVYKPIPELKWGVVVQVPLEEAYQPLREIYHTTLQWLIMAFLLAFGFSLFITKRLTSPIKQLSKEMVQVSKGILEVHIDSSREDEVGQLTRSFNQMIQDLKRSQQSLQEAEEKYRRIFENSKDMIYITSVDGRFIDVNQAGVEMFCFENREELMERNVGTLYVNPDDRKRFADEIARAGFVKDFEVQLLRKDGRPVDALITATVRKDEEGQIISYEGTIKDISDRKRMEDELYQRTKELETLHDLSILINQTLDLDQILPMALQRVLALTGFEMGTIYLLSDDREWLELKYHQNYPSHLLETVKRLKKGEGVVGTTVEKKEVIILPIEQYTTPHILPSLIRERVKTLVGIPLLSKGEPVGAVCLTSRSDRLVKGHEIHFLKSIGNQVGMALENAKLFTSVSKAKSEWETTFDTVTDLITIRDREHRLLRANRAAYQRWGMTPEEMIGKKCYEMIHHLSSPCEHCYISESLRTGKPVSGERESRYLRGFFRYYTYPVYGESGEIVAVVDLAREITEERQLELEKEVVNKIYKILASSLDVREVFKGVHLELKKVIPSERMTLLLFDHEMKEFRLFALDKDYETEGWWEEATYPLEGTPSGEVAQTGLPVMITNLEESDYWSSKALLREGLRSVICYPMEYQGRIIGTINFASQEVHPFSEKHLALLRQIVPSLAIAIQNAILIEETKRSEERYRTVVEGAHDGICVIGMDNRFRYLNQKMGEITGIPVEQLVEKDFRETLTEESRQIIADRFEQWRKGKTLSPRFELNILRPGGEIRFVEIHARVMRDNQGNAHYICFVKDLTEHKRMEEQLIQTEKLRALGEMASGVAHDFNNALAAILGNTQLLLYTVQDEEAKESLRTIEKVAKDSAQTVKRLQDFTRKRVREELFQLDINGVLRDVVEMTRPRWKDEAQRKGIQFEVASHLEEVSRVPGNASEMREAITNILLNAMEAMPEGGKIELRTFQREGRVFIRISDTGIGMDDLTRQKIFEPFFTTKPFSNTGLGLSVSYGIIKRFGGEIEVESQVGSGTTFTIILPVAQGGREETIDLSHSLQTGKPLQILVIDDEDTVREVLSKMLSRANHQVTAARDGEEGLSLFQERTFDMVLTDLGMPGMSGWEVCKKIKEIRPSIPVGMITGWGLQVDEDMKKEAGLDFVLTKPFDFNQVLRVVLKTMESRFPALC